MARRAPLVVRALAVYSTSSLNSSATMAECVNMHHNSERLSIFVSCSYVVVSCPSVVVPATFVSNLLNAVPCHSSSVLAVVLRRLAKLVLIPENASATTVDSPTLLLLILTKGC